MVSICEDNHEREIIADLLKNKSLLVRMWSKYLVFSNLVGYCSAPVITWRVKTMWELMTDYVIMHNIIVRMSIIITSITKSGNFGVN